MSTHYPPGPWLRVVLNFGNDDGLWENILWYKITSAIPSSTDVEAVAADLGTAFTIPMLPLLASTAFWLGVDAYLNNGTYTVRGSTVVQTVGTGSGGQLPTEDAVVVAINSGVATREGVGRVFLSAVDEANVAESRLTPAGVAKYVNLCTDMMALNTAGGVSIALGVWSRKANTVYKAIFAQPSAVLGARRKRRPRR